MGALAKDSTLESVLEGLTGYTPVRTAKVTNIDFAPSQFESGKIDTSTGTNANGSGYLRTKEYISLPLNPWIAQVYADRPWITNVFYYDSNKEYVTYEPLDTGCRKLQNYPYCRIHFYGFTNLMSNDDFITNVLKIQYIESAPAENEHFLNNFLFNGNFEYDRDNDDVGDGWTLKNSPTSSSVADNIQTVVPSTANYFLASATVNGAPLNGHKLYVSMTAYTPYASCVLSLHGSSISVAQNTKFERSSTVLAGTASNVTPQITIAAGGQGHAVQIKNIMIIDLTDIYGSGNEPNAQQIDEIVDKWYGGYVPCRYEIKYDDGTMPTDVISLLKEVTASDEITFTNGMVSSIGHYVNGTLKTRATINRDIFGNIISIEEVSV